MNDNSNIQKDKFIAEQKRVFEIVYRHTPHFALAGGTALSWYYLHHRMSYDLDFFAEDFHPEEIAAAMEALSKAYPHRPEPRGVTVTPDSARIQQFFLPIHISPEFEKLKLDFVEDVYPEPKVNSLDGMPVYGEESLYIRKIYAVAGSRSRTTEVGAEVPAGRRVARDLVDIYFLSNRVCPLHKFVVNGLDRGAFDSDLPRRLVIWSKRFSREDFLHEYIEMDLYERPDPKAGIFRHIDAELMRLMEHVVEKG